MVSADLLRRLSRYIPHSIVKILFNLYSPLRGAGIRMTYISPDYREIKVEMPLTWWNRNYVGTHYGGSIYSLADPFYMYILIKNLGSNFKVWDKSACVYFLKPGRSCLFASFSMTEEEIQNIRERALREGRVLVERTVEIVDEQGEEVAKVDKVISVKAKEHDLEG